jgi:hypothetical protein
MVPCPGPSLTRSFYTEAEHDAEFPRQESQCLGVGTRNHHAVFHQPGEEILRWFVIPKAGIAARIQPGGIARKPSFRKRNEFRTLRSSVPYQGLCFFHASVKVHEYRRDLYRRYTRLFFILPLPEQFQPFLFSDPRVLQQSMRIPPNCPHPLQLHACCIGLHPRPRVSSPSIPIFGSPLPSRVQGLLVSKSPRLDSQIDLVPPAPWMAREDTIRIFRQAL